MIQVEENEHVQTLVYQLNKEGKSICGDSFFMKANEEELVCAVADGLGSGSLANESSSAIKDIVETYADEDVESIIERCNQAMKNKRGATASILKNQFHQKGIDILLDRQCPFLPALPIRRSLSSAADFGLPLRQTAKIQNVYVIIRKRGEVHHLHGWA